ncbi:GntR family transcriptional regulator [Candidatus Enterococcus ferrettii]|uniref:GntR family transcriptional regulator, mannosyl-D-glycerate transport/metabolism system repressor n=1 Tax=Candidatus Enterococcus ferrettii TaxID=2815324 RepID=A0ABV0EJW2_9ENTE|nr:GntR family transcriptional regulator [Enterococcus sp. 665A]MBO1338260.1 GntR family transcriptional regulator [Enterococcus sp. 665A]
MTSEALYKSIFNDLCKQIEEGIFSKGDILPTEAKLGKKYNVSRVTIRQAMQLLAENDYVKKIQGSGSHVTYSPVKTTLDRSSKIRSFSEEMLSIQKVPSAQVLKFELVFASNQLSKELDLEEKAPLFYYERILFADEEPYCFEYGYMPTKYFPDFTITNLTGSKMKYIEDERNFSLVYSQQIVHAILADEKLHNYLKVSLNSPLLEVTHFAYTKEALPLHKTCTIFDSTKYQAHFIKIK